jgi:hypothetical protein
MCRTITLLFFAAAVPACAAAVWAAEKDAPFNGKNLDGWTFRGKTPDAENPFYVKDGLLCCKGQPVGYLRTNEKYTGYVFKVEWRWPEGSKPGNNGVLLGVQDGEHLFNNTWPKSIEAQLLHQHAGDILTIGDFPLQTGRNKGRHTVTLKPSNEKPPGQWNQFEATLQDGRLKLVINGELQNEATEVAKIPGYIALQSEGAPIEFRNIRLTVLDK